ncbi:MAG: sensor histidine kinase [Ardenticatenaceae bacterium]|nr:sensor histidine kinase [Ardenticatenaceae bacterium]MCB9445792.1 sensor histidine kinase [Ardenticatenaceae bacterium]
MRQFIKLDPAVELEAKETRAFYYLLLLVLAFIYGITLYEAPAMRQPIRLIPFTLLMLLHAGLHWFSPHFVLPRRRLAIYLIIQTGLVVLLSLMTQGTAVSFGLIMALAGETVGMLENWRRAIIAVIGYLILLMFITYLIGGWQSLPAWLGMAAVMMVFVLIYVMLFMQQMTARQEAQMLLAELEDANQQLAAYARQVENLTLETERQRMARELHDTLAQGLAGLILQIEGLEAHLEQGNSEKVAEIAAQAKARARTALAEARQAIGDLRQQSSDSTIEAIAREVERFRRATGIPCDLTLPETLTLPDPMGEHVVRCVSEGLANVVQHARATAVIIHLEASRDNLHLTLHDNGQGFDPARIPAGHYGLVGLRERARLANGELLIDSQPHQGTTLTLIIPVKHE